MVQVVGGYSPAFSMLPCEIVLTSSGFYTNCGLRHCHLRGVILGLLRLNRPSHEGTNTQYYIVVACEVVC